VARHLAANRKDSAFLSGRLARRLLTWFDRHQRPLPWRKNRDPYRIWVSEVMLQQTQVATVAKFFGPFLKRFQTLRRLAGASEQEVLRAWEGMGYYRRARHLHQAARLVMRHHGGQVPRDARVFGQLPGVGRYMCGAVLSQAYEMRLPILEANSERVLCRLVGERNHPRSPAARRRLWRLAAELVPARRAGDFNQALMELGAVLCRPLKPQCDVCPLASDCQAKAQRLQARIPTRASPPRRLKEREVALVVRRRGRILLCQRGGTGRWAGMWEFPRMALAAKEPPAAGAGRLGRRLGLHVQSGPRQIIKHTVTHHDICLRVFDAIASRATVPALEGYTRCRWIYPAQLIQYPIARPQRRILIER
jgi:A/G-specific adenine glycosylase